MLLKAEHPRELSIEPVGGTILNPRGGLVLRVPALVVSSARLQPLHLACKAEQPGRLNFLRGYLLAGHLTGRRLSYGRFQVERLEGAVHSEGPNRFKVSVSGGRAYAGAFRGSLSADLNVPDVAFAGQLDLTDIDMNQLLDQAFGFSDVCRGRLSGRLAWRGTGATLEDLHKRWRVELEGRTSRVELRNLDRVPVAAAFFRGLEGLRLAGRVKPLKDVSSVAQLLGLGALKDVYTVKPSSLHIVMQDGKVRLRGTLLQATSGARLLIEGEIGLDGGLAGTIALVDMAEDWRLRGDARFLEAPVRKAIAGGGLRVAVSGTWERPRLDWSGWSTGPIMEEGLRARPLEQKERKKEKPKAGPKVRKELGRGPERPPR